MSKTIATQRREGKATIFIARSASVWSVPLFLSLLLLLLLTACGSGGNADIPVPPDSSPYQSGSAPRVDVFVELAKVAPCLSCKTARQTTYFSKLNEGDVVSFYKQEMPKRGWIADETGEIFGDNVYTKSDRKIITKISTEVITNGSYTNGSVVVATTFITPTSYPTAEPTATYAPPTPTMIPLPYMQTSEAGRIKAEATQRVEIATNSAPQNTVRPTNTAPLVAPTPQPTVINTPTPLTQQATNMTPTSTPVLATDTPTPLPTAYPTATPYPTAAPRPTTTPLPRIAAPSSIAWNDPQGRVSLAYPATWHVVPANTYSSDELFEIMSSDGQHLSVFADRTTSNAMSGIQGYRARQQKRTDRNYYFDESTTLSLDGLPAVSMAYQSRNVSDPSDIHTAQIIYVSNGTTLLAFEYYVEAKDLSGEQSNALENILSSVKIAR